MMRIRHLRACTASCSGWRVRNSSASRLLRANILIAGKPIEKARARHGAPVAPANSQLPTPDLDTPTAWKRSQNGSYRLPERRTRGTFRGAMALGIAGIGEELTGTWHPGGMPTGRHTGHRAPSIADQARVARANQTAAI
jgi:hypothetical protein